jgi:hypothetical protein
MDSQAGCVDIWGRSAEVFSVAGSANSGGAPLVAPAVPAPAPLLVLRGAAPGQADAAIRHPTFTTHCSLHSPCAATPARRSRSRRRPRARPRRSPPWRPRSPPQRPRRRRTQQRCRPRAMRHPSRRVPTAGRRPHDRARTRPTATPHMAATRRLSARRAPMPTRQHPTPTRCGATQESRPAGGSGHFAAAGGS